MATTTTSLSSPSSLTFIFKPKPPNSIINNTHNNSSSLPFTSQQPLTLSTIHYSAKRERTIHCQNPPHANAIILHKATPHLWSISAISEDIVVPSDTTITPLESAEQIISTTKDDGVSIVISTLLFVAFIGLTILTIGVIYIAVTDFLGKRERDKFDKEEAAKKKKGGNKKGKVRARAGPKGFGQKIDDNDDDFLDD